MYFIKWVCPGCPKPHVAISSKPSEPGMGIYCCIHKKYIHPSVEDKIGNIIYLEQGIGEPIEGRTAKNPVKHTIFKKKNNECA